MSLGGTEKFLDIVQVERACFGPGVARFFDRIEWIPPDLPSLDRLLKHLALKAERLHDGALTNSVEFHLADERLDMFGA
jgi:hypothetical protein